MADQITSTVSSQNFAEKVLEVEQLVIVNFFSNTSNSCKIFEAEFVAVGKEYQSRAIFAQVEVDLNEQLVHQYGIEGIPTLLFFKGGQEINRIKGIVMREKLRRQIEGALLVSSSRNSGEPA